MGIGSAYCGHMTSIDVATAHDEHLDAAEAADDDFPQGMLASPTRIRL